MGTTIPTPLYSLYRSLFDLTPILITVTYSAYAIVVVPSLFLSDRLADKYGRKPVLLVATLIGIVAILFRRLRQRLHMAHNWQSSTGARSRHLTGKRYSGNGSI